ncbi:hypothetical protein [Sphingobium sp.]|uniref:DUF6950 family protein n=1 Tax=Sphingobium sp. TaxID=1912891 RepID=UPI0035C76F90
MIELGTFLREMGNRRRVPGKWDCCAMPAEWAILNGWPDPMAHWRGAYDTEEGAARFIEDAGSLTQLFRCGMENAGIPERRGDVRIGDIGVLRVGGMEAGAIFTGKRWAMVADRGLAVASVEIEAVSAAWSVCG